MTDPAVDDRFRHDIGGLRGLAVSVVVVFHVQSSWMPGGYLGVDVFFVISGFLISGSLLRELDASQGIRLGQFWGRRVRRLVPALAVVVAATLAASSLVLAPSERLRVAREAPHAIGYVANLLFAREGSDYFAPDTDGSLFLHLWSLGVEEQFYLLWPLLCLGAVGVGRRLGWSTRRALAVGWGAVVVASFGTALRLTGEGSPWAFFGLPSRAWEFGLGALVAVGTEQTAVERTRLRQVGRMGGLLLLTVAVVGFDDLTLHPGWATWLPVGGAAAVIASGAPGRAPGLVLGHPVLRHLGRVSYAWYLWHWPVILLAAAHLGDRPAVRASAGLLSLGLADLTSRFVEDPVRYSRSLRASLPATFALGLALSLVALTGAVGLRVHAVSAGESPFQRLLTAARHDTAPVFVAGRCRSQQWEEIEFCELGDPSGPVLVLAGDSHAAQWVPALDAVSERLGLRLVVRTTGACPAPPISVSGAVRGVEVPGCRRFRTDTWSLIEGLDAAAVIVSARVPADRVLAAGGAVRDRAEQVAIWSDAVDELAGDLAESGVAFGAILDTPGFPVDPLVCAGRSGSFTGCGVARAEVIERIGLFRDVEARAIRGAGGRVFDPLPLACPDPICAVEVDGMVRYWDRDHLSATFVRSLEPEVLTFVSSLVAGARPG